MAKKKITNNESAVTAATGEAALILQDEMNYCRETFDRIVGTAWGPESRLDASSRIHITDIGIELLKASAELASAIAKLRGEFHQHIEVERFSRSIEEPRRSTKRLEKPEGGGAKSEKQPPKD